MFRKATANKGFEFTAKFKKRIAVIIYLSFRALVTASYSYSVRRLFTGLVIAALID